MDATRSAAVSRCWCAVLGMDGWQFVMVIKYSGGCIEFARNSAPHVCGRQLR